MDGVVRTGRSKKNETIEETAYYISDLVGYKVAVTVDNIQEALENNLNVRLFF